MRKQVSQKIYDIQKLRHMRIWRDKLHAAGTEVTEAELLKMWKKFDGFEVVEPEKKEWDKSKVDRANAEIRRMMGE